jgi:hypothetical protein
MTDTVTTDIGPAQGIMVLRCADLAEPVPGSRRGQCRDCGQDVWISPSSQHWLYWRPHLVLKCTHCVNMPEPWASRLPHGGRPDATHPD